jgi:hypothetical protein
VPQTRPAPLPRASSIPAFRAVTAAAPGHRLVTPVELGRGLTGYWPFDDAPGSKVIRDISGAGRDCILHDKAGAAVTVTGVAGAALDLKGKAWLECPQPAVNRETAVAITVAAWVRRTAQQTPGAIATRQIGRGFEDHFFFGWKEQSLRVISHAWSGITVVPAPAPAQGWVHTAFTHDHEGSTRMYIDGLEVSHAEGAPLGRGPVANPITIGAGRYSRQETLVRQHLDGAVDDLLIYDRALSPEEIGALAAGVRPQPAR